MNKKILGLDLGTTSIGWALIETDSNYKSTTIKDMGVRIIPITTESVREYTTGNTPSINQKRREKRTQRKGYYRYQIRRENLTNKLKELGMLPDETLIKLPILELWQLRANAATNQQISLPELGRVLYHLNQKRGYKHGKIDEGEEDKKQKDYVEEINSRYEEIKRKNQTIAQYFVQKLKENKIEKDDKFFHTYRIKGQDFPREAYIAEFDQIMNAQKTFYPDILTDENINTIRNKIIYYQRNLKSCKHLISNCEFESGCKVISRSSPLFQVYKIWQSINNLKLKKNNGDCVDISIEQKREMFNYLNTHVQMSFVKMCDVLKIKKDDLNIPKYLEKKGIQGNTTKDIFKNIIDSDDLLKFDLETKVVNRNFECFKEINENYINQPLYKLWHVIFSISDVNELKNVLEKCFNISNIETIKKLLGINFSNLGYGNISAKFIRKILPYLEEGLIYSDACKKININHSNSLTKKENKTRGILTKISHIRKNELRNPIVEKILNQTINLVNAIIKKHGNIDTIRIELCRELKQCKKKRKDITKRQMDNEKKNKNYEKIIKKCLSNDSKVTKNMIEKYKLWEECGGKCFYCDDVIVLKNFLYGIESEKEHIIPKSLFFDDSFNNKVCACRKCNQAKSNKTGYDFMKCKCENEFKLYSEKIENLYSKNIINKSKKDILLTSQDKIPKDFIVRQLKETQYITKKITEILQQVTPNIEVTIGVITGYLRYKWKYDNILHDINKEENKQTEIIGKTNKRNNHKHHTIDALVIACTSKKIINRLNQLNANYETSLNEYINLEKPPFEIEYIKNKIKDIFTSFKSGKKVTTNGKRRKYINGKMEVLQENTQTPRGALHEDKVYGKIKVIEKNKNIKHLFKNTECIHDKDIKKLIDERLILYNNNINDAIKSLEKKPIFLNNGKELKKASCFKDETVIRYSIESIIENNKVSDVVDKRIRTAIKKWVAKELESLNKNIENNSEGYIEDIDKKNNKEIYKSICKNLSQNPIYVDDKKIIPIKNARCFTGLNAVVPVKFNENKQAIGFVKTGNNHHLAIYTDNKGKKQEHIVTFWHAVERKKNNIPVIITNPAELCDRLVNINMSKTFLDNLPESNWIYENSFQINEFFILGMDEDKFQNAIKFNDYRILSNHLYRVQSITHNDYKFILHSESNVDKTQEVKKYRVSGISTFLKLNPHKVQISLLGELIFKD